MIFIYKELIKKYINCLTPEQIKQFAIKNNETLTNSELQIIYNYILKYNKDILNGDTSSFKSLKQHLRKDLYEKIENLYNEYKIYI